MVYCTERAMAVNINRAINYRSPGGLQLNLIACNCRFKMKATY